MDKIMTAEINSPKNRKSISEMAMQQTGLDDKETKLA